MGWMTVDKDVGCVLFRRLDLGLRMFLGIIVAVTFENQHLHRVGGSSQMDRLWWDQRWICPMSPVQNSNCSSLCVDQKKWFPKISAMDSRNFFFFFSILLKVI